MLKTGEIDQPKAFHSQVQDMAMLFHHSGGLTRLSMSQHFCHTESP